MEPKQSTNNTLKVLLIGSLPPPLGGVTVLFKSLVNALGINPSIRLDVVNIPFGRHSNFNRLMRVFQVCRKVIEVAPNVDVLTLHVPSSVLPILGPLIYIIAKLYHKPLVIRKFGGMDYTQYGCVKRILSKWAVNRCDAYLAEAKQLVSVARKHGARKVYWYPNNRPYSSYITQEKRAGNKCRKFVYVGQIYKEKGVFEISKAAEDLSLEFPVDFYGPYCFHTRQEEFRKFRNVRHMGILNPDNVISVLKKYDALIIPTYASTEGYPGVIIEAYCAGIPVICTNWRFLPEIVDETSGLFVEPQNIQDLKFAMQKLLDDHDLYTTLCAGASQKAQEFTTERWAQTFIDICRSCIR